MNGQNYSKFIYLPDLLKILKEDELFEPNKKWT